MQNKMKSRALALMLVVVLVCAVLSGCAATVSNPSIGKVGDIELHYSDLYSAYNQYYIYYTYGMITLEEGQTFGDFLVSALVESTMPVAVAHATGLTLDEEEEAELAASVEEEYQEVLAEYAKDLDENATQEEIYDYFIKSIKKNGYTYKSYMARIEAKLRDDALGQKILAQIYAKAEVTDEMVVDWYNAQIEIEREEYAEDPAAYYNDFMYYSYDTGVPPLVAPEDYYYIKQIFIKFADESEDAAEDAVTAEEVAAKVAEVQAKLDAGEDFDALIEEYNEDTGVSSYPDGYPYNDAIADKYYEAFSEAAAALELGEISAPVESTSGYHFLYKVSAIPTDPVPLEEVREAIYDYLLELEEYELYKAASEKWYEEIKVNLNTTRINYYLSSIASSN